MAKKDKSKDLRIIAVGALSVIISLNCCTVPFMITETAFAQDAVTSDLEETIPAEQGESAGESSGDTTGESTGDAAGESSGESSGDAMDRVFSFDMNAYDYTGENNGVLTADGQEIISDGETVSSEEPNVNALLAKNDGTLVFTNGTVYKSGDNDDGDSTNFYGINSISLTVGENSRSYISDSTLNASSAGSNGIFSTDKAISCVKNVTIDTTGAGCHGLDATYAGTILADGVNIVTHGSRSAVLATDRGGGNLSVTNSTVATEGDASPIFYSTGNIQVDHVTGSSVNSQIAVIDGKNTILMWNSEFISSYAPESGFGMANGIQLYYSVSGDSETSTGEGSRFQAVNTTLSSAIKSGAMFYVNKTAGSILLSCSNISFDTEAAALLLVAGGTAGSLGASSGESAGSSSVTGANAAFTARNQVLEGRIEVDNISTLDFYLLDESSYTGYMIITENSEAAEAAAEAAEDADNSADTEETGAEAATEPGITVNISADSAWIITQDTTISSLNAEEGAKILDTAGNPVTIIAGGVTVAEGSETVLTVEGSYSTTFTTGEVNEITGDFIDRTPFDEYFKTSTAFGTNSAE
ncbi:MAG: hypothetical protein HUJ76_09290 [Parasporobacterium sp.]|nr:hypothetical protein [Parasporobacterium sp.]